MIPFVVLCAEAGSGKDSLGEHLINSFGGYTLGFADPLKLMARDLLGFTDQQLWGPSQYRNEIDARFKDPEELRVHFVKCGSTARKWCERLFPQQSERANTHLCERWMHSCIKQAGVDGGLSPRYVLQTLGTEWGRHLDSQVWVNYAFEVGKTLLCGGHTYSRTKGLEQNPEAPPAPLVVVTDGRFPNEHVNLRARGALAIEIVRPKKVDTTSTGVVGHSSETSLSKVPRHFYDAVIVNDSSLQGLLNVGLVAVEGLIKSPRYHFGTVGDLMRQPQGSDL